MSHHDVLRLCESLILYFTANEDSEAAPGQPQATGSGISSQTKENRPQEQRSKKTTSGERL